jgi:nitrogen-specific signal transduction histidine kinase
MQLETVIFAQPERLSTLLQRMCMVQHKDETAMVVNAFGVADAKELESSRPRTTMNLFQGDRSHLDL